MRLRITSIKAKAQSTCTLRVMSLGDDDIDSTGNVSDTTDTTQRHKKWNMHQVICTLKK